MTSINLGQEFMQKLARKGNTELGAKAETIFRKRVPPFSEFVTSHEYLGQGRLSTRQEWACLQILGEDPNTLFTDKVNYKNESVLCWGKGSGKDLISSYVISYCTYVLLCMKNPQQFVGLANDEPIDIVNVASNAEQARTVFFNKLKSRMRRPCFAEFNPKLNKTEIIFPNNINIHSLHSANESWEGMNILLWVMDEASAFRTVSGGDNAEQVYGTMRSSARSRFPMIRWIGIIISFPRKQVGDFTLKKFEEAKQNPQIFADRAATWDVHPHYDPTHPMFLNIPMVTVPEYNMRVPEEYLQDFIRDPVDSQTKFMADPPLTEGGFFDTPALIDEAVDNLMPVVDVSTGIREVYDIENGKIIKRVTIEVENLPERDPNATYWMHGDPGLTIDSFALCVCHVSPGDTMNLTTKDGETIILKPTVVDFVLVWKPKPGIPVDLKNQEDIMELLIKRYGIKHVTFDRWNSATSIQRLQDMNIRAESFSFSAEQQTSMYRHLKLLIYNRMLKLPSGHEELLNELKFLKLHNGKITHDIHGKDMADSVAAVVWNAAGRGSRARQMVEETLNAQYTDSPNSHLGMLVSSPHM